MLFAAHHTAISLYRHHHGGVSAMRCQLSTTLIPTVITTVTPTDITKTIPNSYNYLLTL